MKRSGSRRAAVVVLRAVMGLVALVLLVAGAWSSWDAAHHVVLAQGREHGTLTVTECGAETCTGRYEPDATSSARARVTVERSVAAEVGDRFPVVVRPGTDAVVRTGVPGLLHAWMPLGGAMVLAGFVIGGGVRMPRAAWAVGTAGAALLVATFVAL
ncbi:hypothetical protein ACFY9H_10665 [Streptomyces bacillaris]|uniref:Uncharacterized protein n=1 Tax=Streptomyces cavourensis TaxID=67258 RepID=A0AAD0Q3Z8_9ACTN|nr:MULTISPECIES: hypothetical protein [Streptomyces]NUW20170.1 hypothetical protein [Streptomyces roseoviolaceus]ATY96167.1 hypothetical protein CVT27_12325 [Streptomyces cavourensis]AXI72028.1 hypothetical protein DTW94_12615 [Streptomyces cavourensis]MBH0242276.1 hypothetical protein [Streptomyces cavourensis]NUV42800.1 hypothetical protein [Streptomyces sp. CAI-24]